MLSLPSLQDLHPLFPAHDTAEMNTARTNSYSITASLTAAIVGNSLSDIKIPGPNLMPQAITHTQKKKPNRLVQLCSEVQEDQDEGGCNITADPSLRETIFEAVRSGLPPCWESWTNQDITNWLRYGILSPSEEDQDLLTDFDSDDSHSGSTSPASAEPPLTQPLVATQAPPIPTSCASPTSPTSPRQVRPPPVSRSHVRNGDCSKKDKGAGKKASGTCCSSHPSFSVFDSVPWLWDCLESFMYVHGCGGVDFRNDLRGNCMRIRSILGMDQSLIKDIGAHGEVLDPELVPSNDLEAVGEVVKPKHHTKVTPRMRKYRNAVLRKCSSGAEVSLDFLHSVSFLNDVIREYGPSLVLALKWSGLQLSAYLVFLNYIATVRIYLLFAINRASGVKVHGYLLECDWPRHGIQTVAHLMTWMARDLSANQLERPAKEVLLPLLDRTIIDIAEECEYLQSYLACLPCRFQCFCCKICSSKCCGGGLFFGEMATNLEEICKGIEENDNPHFAKKHTAVLQVGCLILLKLQMALCEEVDLLSKEGGKAYHRIIKDEEFEARCARRKQIEIEQELDKIMDAKSKEKNKKGKEVEMLKTVLFGL